MKIEEVVKDAESIGIGGHIRPDGDCVGACMALYLYLRKVFPEKSVELFLERPSEVFHCIKDIDKIRTDVMEGGSYDGDFDVFIALDTVKERLGAAQPLFDRAEKTVNIDHHISNKGCGTVNYIDPHASSTDRKSTRLNSSHAL